MGTFSGTERELHARVRQQEVVTKFWKQALEDDLRSESRFSNLDLLIDHDVIGGISVIIGSIKNPSGVLGALTTERREFTEHASNFVRCVANMLRTATKRIGRERKLERCETIAETVNDDIYAVDEELPTENSSSRCSIGFTPLPSIPARGSVLPSVNASWNATKAEFGSSPSSITVQRSTSRYRPERDR